MGIKVVIPITNSESTVTRLIVKSVIEQLMYTTEMAEIADIQYIPRGGITAMAQMNTVEEPLKLDVENHIQVEYKETTNDQFDYSKYQFEYPAIFKASALGIQILPMHSKVQLEMTLTYKSKSYSDLTLWLAAFNRRLLNTVAMSYHDVLYNYTLPTDAMAYLTQVYDLMEAVAPYDITLNTFLQHHFCTEGIIVRQNLNDSKQAMAINVKNTGCIGTFTQLPEIVETSKEPPMSQVSFTYVLDYDRVNAIILEYQMYIHNQVIDLVFLRKYEDRRYHANPHAGNRTFTQAVNAVTQNQYGVADYPDAGTNTGDGWAPTTIPPSTYTATVFPIQLDLTNLVDILDLTLLSQFNYPAWLISLMRVHSDKLCAFGVWPVNLELFEVNATNTLMPIFVNSEFHLTSKLVLNPRNRYYVRVSVLTNLLKMDFSAMQKDPWNLNALLQWIDPAVNLTIIGNGSWVTNDSLWAALNLINRSDLKLWNGLTVQSTTINAAKDLTFYKNKPR